MLVFRICTATIPLLLMAAGCGSGEAPNGAGAPFAPAANASAPGATPLAPTGPGAAATSGDPTMIGAPGAGAGGGAATPVPGAGAPGVPDTPGPDATAPTATGPDLTQPPPDGDVGNKVIHRLSAVEYDNTVRDLLGTELSFDDGAGHDEAEGFDNIAAAMTMSPRQLENYYDAARELAAEAFAGPGRDRIVECTLDAADVSCAQASIENFGLRAFRRPLSADEQGRFLGLYEEAIELGETPDDAMRLVVQAMLAAPQFLYRVEFDADPSDPTPHPVSDYELASRLSYALWSSMPDDELFSLAAAEQLHNVAVLEAQVDRMLEDDRAEMLATNFAAQWLGSRRLDGHTASPELFPGYTPELAQSMQREMELYFLEFLHADLDYADFLTTDVNFVDATLAAHYGYPAPAGDGFEQVQVPDDGRQGAIGLAGFLTHTSRDTRSSPIIRGKWILDAVWCVPLELPEDLVVDDLPQAEEGEGELSVRETIEQHRADPACSPCHNLMDPIGLSLEHFDAIGQPRTEYTDGLPIDSSGELPSGAVVSDLASLSDELSADARFVPCAAQKFNTYALGASTNSAYLDHIVARWSERGTTLRNLIKTSITSDTFLMRRGANE